MTGNEKGSPVPGEPLFTDRRANMTLTKRVQQPWPTNKKFKILSLDGGGIRGIYGATILKLIERNLTQGKPVGEYFDLIAGTSTGGIMALGLGLKIPADQIEKFYRIDGKKIFHQSFLWKVPGVKFIHHAIWPLYDHRILEKVLHREFGDKILGDSSARLVIPAFLAEKTEIAVFKTDHHIDYKKDYKSKMWEVARSTSAAPTFFKGLISDKKILLDGGIWANNPTMIAIVEALSAYDVPLEQIEVLSIGTGNFPFKITLKKAMKGFLRWLEVIKGAMYLTTDNAHSQAWLLLGPERLIRLQPTKENADIELDDWGRAIELLPQMAQEHFEAQILQIKPFFDAPAKDRERFYTTP